MSALVETLTEAHFEVGESVSIDDYERFEFAGDKVIGWVVAELIIENYPRLVEGAATMLVSKLVCEEMLSLFAREYNLIDSLRAGPYQRPGLIVNPRIQCDIFEAYVGVVHAELGYPAARDWLRLLFAPLLDNEYAKLKQTTDRADEVRSGIRDLSLNVAAFNQLCQQRGLVPHFDYTEEGPSHKRVYRCTASVEGQTADGEGTSKKAAKHDALIKIGMLYTR